MRTPRTHLITGVAGQDGVLLARALLARGDRVVGTTQNGNAGVMACYLAGVEVRPHDLRDHGNFRNLIHELRPDSILNFAAVSSVAHSWQEPTLTKQVNQTAVEQMLASLRDLGLHRTRFVQASSADIFGPPAESGEVTTENTSLNPVSPYAEAKANAHLAVLEARREGLSAGNVILFGHTSVLQRTEFVLADIARQAAEVGAGARAFLSLRDPQVRRDWGSASDVVNGVLATLGSPPDDFVLATGRLHSLAEVSTWALGTVQSGERTARTSGEVARPHDFDGRIGDSARARAVLGWTPSISLESEIKRMVTVNTRRILSGVDHDPGDLPPGPPPSR